ncbi:energy-coupling factor transporter transmembrane component T [Allofustis seminis]|uniref:energy-coupling factor transporter transmembrane component T n=1 Tax=Allofustis seminis TaxID=166939 RepID=UPI0003731842|nr:energy-coupling factor transporter transmembrane component T [Allofustis seminis]
MGEITLPKNRITTLYPLTKCAFSLLIVLVAITTFNIYGKLAILAAINLLAALSGVWQLFNQRLFKSVGILIVLITLLQTFFYPGHDVLFALGRFTATREGLTFALKLGLNLANIGGAIIWLFTVTTEKDFVLALEKQGMSAKASYVVLSTLQMVPVLKKQSQLIMKAQSARGVETEGNVFVRAKAFVPTLIPLVLSSIQGTEERALTLEARGFSLDRPKTYYYDIHPEPRDKMLVTATGILAVAYVIGKVVYWLWV